LLMASFLPWYSFGYTAWGLSWRWNLGLVLALVAAGVWLPLYRDHGAVPARVRYALLAMTLAAIGLTVWEGRLLAPSPASAMTLLYGVGVDGRTDLSAEEVRQLVPPEVLAALNDAAFLDIGPRWGYLVGLAAMALIAIAILVSGAAGGRRPTARGY